ncbi:MAG: Gfo/Idh/MocA family oxidoreductase [Bryobacterales bacterium]|nr:Gfo/Idh/MocA family oxidoreductase [Bryobacterales bacterium]
MGLGHCGDAHLGAWRSLDQAVRLPSICDESLAIRMRAAQAGFTVYENALDMAKKESLDAVSICTPNCSHEALAASLLRQGVAALCEIPLTIDLSGAFRLFDLAECRRTVFAPAAKFRFAPAVTHARDLIAAGEIGQILNFRVEFARYRNMLMSWKSLPEVAGGGVLRDQGGNAFDLIHYLIGPLERVRAIRLRQAQPLDVEDSVLVLATARGGVIGEVFLSWSAETGSHNYATVCGTKGTVEIGWRESTLKRHGKEPRQFGGPYQELDAYQRMAQAFLACVQGRQPLWITSDEALDTAFALEMAYHSMRQDATVEMDSKRIRSRGPFA